MKTCSKCGVEQSIDEYYGKRKDCKTCVKAKTAEYRRANPEKVAEAKRKSEAKKPEYYTEMKRSHYEANREDIITKQKAYQATRTTEKRVYDKRRREADPERFRIEARERYLANPESFRFHRRLRKARVRGSIVELDRSTYDTILKRFDGSCALTTSKDIHMDHFIPVHTGYGDTTEANMIPLDATLNLSKGGKNPFEWIKERDDISITTFSEVVAYLAELNGFTVEEYEAHVYNCFD